MSNSYLEEAHETSEPRSLRQIVRVFFLFGCQSREGCLTVKKTNFCVVWQNELGILVAGTHFRQECLSRNVVLFVGLCVPTSFGEKIKFLLEMSVACTCSFWDKNRYLIQIITSLPLKRCAKWYWSRLWFRLDETFGLSLLPPDVLPPSSHQSVHHPHRCAPPLWLADLSPHPRRMSPLLWLVNNPLPCGARWQRSSWPLWPNLQLKIFNNRQSIIWINEVAPKHVMIHSRATWQSLITNVTNGRIWQAARVKTSSPPRKGLLSDPWHKLIQDQPYSESATFHAVCLESF